MRSIACVLATCAALLQTASPGQAPAPAAAPDDPIRTLVGKLDLEKYKATIKGLTQFGDRRQGTARNRAALDWIEAQLKSYGCTNTERITYTYTPRPAGGRGRGATVDPVTGETIPAPAQPAAAGAGQQQPAAAGAGQRGQGAAQGAGRGRGTAGQGGGRIRGTRARTGVNANADAQPDAKLRELNTEQTPAE